MINDRQATKRIFHIFRQFYVFLVNKGEKKNFYFRSTVLIYISRFWQNLRTIASIFTTQLNLC